MAGNISRENGKKGGRPRGSKSRSTLAKEEARELLRQRVIAELGPLVDAQIAQARGLKYLVTRDRRTGKFIRVTQAMAKAKKLKSNDDEETIEVWEKDPSVQAFSDLMNRAIGKPVEEVDVVMHHDDEAITERLHAARARAARMKRRS